MSDLIKTYGFVWTEAHTKAAEEATKKAVPIVIPAHLKAVIKSIPNGKARTKSSQAE